MTVLRVLIADDESMARRRLLRLLNELHDVEVVGEAEDGVAVLKRIGKGDVDLVLLDIRMPGLTGVEAMRLWPDNGPAIVFTTAHSDHAVEAFDGGAIDYLLKPVDTDRLQRALDRVRDRRGAPSEDLPARLPVHTRRGVILLAVDELSHAVIEGESVVLYTDRGTLFTDMRLADLERRLSGVAVRVHRQALVNIRRVVRLEPTDSGGYIAHTDAGGAVAVSRQVARRLRKQWDL